MNPMVAEAALLYTTDRKSFRRKYSRNPLVTALLDEVFLESESRPDLAERIAIKAINGIPSPTKKGYDGTTADGTPIEAKVRNFAVREDGTYPQGQTAHNINDVSRAIVDRYKEDQPLMVFPYFYDGHLAAVFSVPFSVLEEHYEACLANHQKGRCCFKLSASAWASVAKIEFLHKDPLVVAKLPQVFRKHIAKGQHTMSIIRRLSTGKQKQFNQFVDLFGAL